MELITEDNILYSIILFSFMFGVFACRVATRLFEVSHAARIAQSTVYRCLLMCSKIHEDVEFLLQLKHKYMVETGMKTSKVSSFCEVDRKIMNDWREAIIQRIILTAPPSFSFIIKFTNWREAMQQLGDMHERE